MIPCTTDPDHWFDPDPQAAQDAIQQCLTCPIIDKCRELGWSEHHGVWGGQYRGILRKPRGRPKKTPA